MRVVPGRLAFLVSLCCLIACTEQKPGGFCEQRFTDTGLCSDATGLIICTSGKYVRYPCPGPNGCVQTGNAWACDFRESVEGSACPSVMVGLMGCSLDGGFATTCTESGWVSRPCRLCTESAVAVHCVPPAGTSCDDGGMLCDGKTLVSCEGSTWQNFACTGPLGCSPSLLAGAATAFRACDFSGTDAGQPCPASFSDRTGYCASSTELLQCHAGAFTSVPCTSCTTDGGVATCQ